jgi:hypothetical protein
MFYRGISQCQGPYEVIKLPTIGASQGGMRVSTNGSCRHVKSPPGGSILRYPERLTEMSTEMLTSQVLPTSQQPTGILSTETSTQKSTEKSPEKSRGQSTKSTKILLKPPIKSNHEVDRMVTEADFQSRLPSQAASGSQCHLPMTTGCKRYSLEHEKALHEGSRKRRHA